MTNRTWERRRKIVVIDYQKITYDHNLKPFSLRPAGIDTTFHPEIHDWIPKRKGMERLIRSVLLPILRYPWGGMVSPAKDLAKVLTELASSDGVALEGKGIEREGRTINMRRLARI
jgi:hypothetical protein